MGNHSEAYEYGLTAVEKCCKLVNETAELQKILSHKFNAALESARGDNTQTEKRASLSHRGRDTNKETSKKTHRKSSTNVHIKPSDNESCESLERIHTFSLKSNSLTR